MIKPTEGAQASRKLLLSISEAAEALGVSDDLIYELTARGELPFVRLGRRKLIPAVAIQAVIDGCLDGFRVSERFVDRTNRRSGRRSAAECLLEISDASIEAVFASEREEAMVPVEGEGSIVDRIDDHGTRAELS
jgi:excisionase family DNA binding protein